jgi:hypothetical protein
MAIYISVDGDDTGNKIAKSYLENDEIALARIIQELTSILTQICEYLRFVGFEIIYCAADGIACKGSTLDIDNFIHHIRTIRIPNYTFSVGIGNDLQTSYLALKYAKAVGKDKIVIYEEGARFRIVNIVVD